MFGTKIDIRGIRIMKKRLFLYILLAAALVIGCLSNVTDVRKRPEEACVEDGRDRPSNCGRLKVVDGQLCDKNGEPVILRGPSGYGISVAESFINEKLFSELSRDMGCNVFRLPVYTYGTGTVGYCNGGNKDRIDECLRNGVAYADNNDMYAIVDWHVLREMDPNKYIEDAKVFFDKFSKEFADRENVIYEICNEPNNVEWEDIVRYANEIIPIIRANDKDSLIIVGTPDWSKQIDDAFEDPLDYDNIMYTFHFYAASHKEKYQVLVRKMSEKKLPIFVTEFGVTASSGGFPRDLEEADRWIELLEEEGISYCMWSFVNIPEACSAIRHQCVKYNGFTDDDYSETGLWLKKTIMEHK